MKNKTIVLFRTAGGKAKNRQLGLGHIFRVINIAKKLISADADPESSSCCSSIK